MVPLSFGRGCLDEGAWMESFHHHMSTEKKMRNINEKNIEKKNTLLYRETSTTEKRNLVAIRNSR